MLDESFWSSLASYKRRDVFNPWADVDAHDLGEGDIAPRMRTARLRLHFELPAKYLLIGEAPGYRGCHFSGIPFTCEKQLCDGVVPRIGDRHRITKRLLPYSEASATVIWRTLYQLNIAEDTKMWNTYAWHPHVEDLPMSNRTPTPREVMEGAGLLSQVVKAFRDAKIISVGKIAGRMLSAMGVGHYPVRHPSMGGARHFLEGMEKLTARETEGESK